MCLIMYIYELVGFHEGNRKLLNDVNGLNVRTFIDFGTSEITLALN